MLRDTNQRDTTTELFGHQISAPIVFAPIGVNKIYHNDGELAPAKVAGELGLPYCLRYLLPLQNPLKTPGWVNDGSTAGSQPIEDVGKANGKGPRFYQLYLPMTTNWVYPCSTGLGKVASMSVS